MPRFKFSDIAHNIRESRAPTPADEATYIGLEHLDADSLTVSRWGSEVPLKGNKLQMKKGDLLFGKRNAYLRRAAIAPHDGLFSAHGMVFRPNTDVIDKNLFPFFICSDAVFDAAIRISVGSLSPTVNWRDLSELEFVLPSMGEQAKAAEKLWAANEARESYRRLISLVDELVKSQFVEMFAGHFKPSHLGGCCSDVLSGKTPSMSHPEFYGGDVPFIKSGDIHDPYVSEGSLSLTKTAIDSHEARFVPAGSVIVVVRSAALQHEFRHAIASSPVVINQDLKALVPTGEFRSEYLYYAISVSIPELLTKVQTMVTSHIDLDDLLNIPVPKADVDTQDRFAAFVAAADKSKFAVRILPPKGIG